MRAIRNYTLRRYRTFASKTAQNCRAGAHSTWVFAERR
jgi:hypothetical protein